MLWIDLQKNGAQTLTQQLYQQLVTRILEGYLPAGSRLPSTRELARNASVSRNIAIEVYEQLTSEGYLFSKPGSGTFVSQVGLVRKRQLRRQQDDLIRSATAKESSDLIHFACGLPDLAHFPRERWLRCSRAIGFNGENELWGYESSKGSARLRQAICRHVSVAKGIPCSPEQVIITGGSAGLHLLVNFEDILFSSELRERLRQEHAVSFEAADDYATDAEPRPGALALGFGNLSLEQIAEGVRRLERGTRSLFSG